MHNSVFSLELPRRSIDVEVGNLGFGVRTCFEWPGRADDKTAVECGVLKGVTLRCGSGFSVELDAGTKDGSALEGVGGIVGGSGVNSTGIFSEEELDNDFITRDALE